MYLRLHNNYMKTNDDIWKFWTLELLRSFPKEPLTVLQPDIERMAHSPTKGEKLENIDKSAYEILSSIV